MTDRIDLKRSLQALAFRQGGYFTARQAISIGFSYQAQKYHVDRGNWSKVDRALFRLPDWPHTASDEYSRWFVWSQGNGVISHQSAARAHLLADFVSEPVHLTMRPGTSTTSVGVTLHVGALNADEVVDMNGFKATSVVRTICDLAAGAIGQEGLDRAVWQASLLYQPLMKDLRRAVINLEPRIRISLDGALFRIPV
jgi:hypothetical protein